VDASGKVYVADARNQRIQKFSGDGQFIRQWGGQGDAPGQFERPSGLAVDGEGNIFVADYELDRIQKFTPDGEYLMQWGSPGKNAGQFNSPTGIVIDSRQNIFVTDTYNHRVQKFDLQGNFIREWGKYNPVSVIRSFFSFLMSPGGEGDLLPDTHCGGVKRHLVCIRCL
jgi:DNA-binding beta-propeller fold protein YncE